MLGKIYLKSFIIFVVFWSCETPDPALTRMERKWIDSTYQKQVKLIKKELDSICIIQNDSIYKRDYDSILQKRRDERELIIQKLKKTAE